MRVRLSGIELHGALESLQGCGILFLFHTCRAQVEISDANIFSQPSGLLKQRRGFLGLVVLQRNIAEIGQSLSVVRIEGQLGFKLSLCVLVIA